MGARSVAMGGAQTALASDADGFLVNPAGLSMIKGQQITATVGVLYLGLSDNSLISQNILGYAYQQSGLGALGVVWKRLGVENLYSENTLALALARDFRLYLKKSEEDRRKNFSFGAAMNLMSWDSAPTVGADGKVVEDLSGWRGFSFDIGFVIRPSENVPVAVTIQSLNRPNIASSGATERLPTTARMGVAATEEKLIFSAGLELQSDLNSNKIPEVLQREILLPPNALVLVDKKDSSWTITDGNKYKLYTIRKEGDRLKIYGGNITWAMDMILRDGQLDLRVGLEKTLYSGNILLRAGFSLENLAWGTNFTLGAGYKPSSSMRIDYAFVYPVKTIRDTMGSHRISVVYNFGR